MKALVAVLGLAAAAWVGARLGGWLYDRRHPAPVT